MYSYSKYMLSQKGFGLGDIARTNAHRCRILCTYDDCYYYYYCYEYEYV